MITMESQVGFLLLPWQPEHCLDSNGTVNYSDANIDVRQFACSEL